MARPLTHQTGDVIAVSIDGLGIAWCDGIFAGDQELVENAKLNARLSRPIELFRCDLVCDASTPLGALAAMASWNPGRAVLIQSTDEINDFFEENERYV